MASDAYLPFTVYVVGWLASLAASLYSADAPAKRAISYDLGAAVASALWPFFALWCAGKALWRKPF